MPNPTGQGRLSREEVMQDRRYVSTTRDGRSRAASGDIVWELPGLKGEPGEATTPTTPSHGVELRTADGLLDALGERIFVAEPVATAGGSPAPDRPPGSDDPPLADEPAGVGGPAPLKGSVIGVGAARLVEETAWDDEAAARFALESASHALGGEGEVVLPHGRTLAGVLGEVRQALEQGEGAGPGLGRLARMATLHRLRKSGDAISALAMAAVKEDDRSGTDLMDDPAWASLAAISEAVLATVEALRYRAQPERAGREEARGERQRGAEPPTAGHIEETPFGPIALGVERIPAHLTAATCAAHAAERARQAVADRDGEEAGRAERAFQAHLLEQLLEGTPLGT